VRAHVAEVRARLPRATILLQVDEPSLPSVLAGRVPTESGLGMLRSVTAAAAREALERLVTAVGVPVVFHCCAAGAPLALLRAAGATAVAVDLSLIDDLDTVGELIDAGVGLFAGTAPAKATVMADAVRDLWGKLGFPAAQLGEQVVVSPPCGLADTRPAQVSKVLEACREAGRRLAE
jgi:hypothetical protein